MPTTEANKIPCPESAFTKTDRDWRENETNTCLRSQSFGSGFTWSIIFAAWLCSRSIALDWSDTELLSTLWETEEDTESLRTFVALSSFTRSGAMKARRW